MNRQKMPTTRRSMTHKLTIHTSSGKVRIYFTVGLFENGKPGELFIKVDKDGAAIDGSLKSWALAISMLLQSGWTVDDLFTKFAHIRHEPSGMTDNKEIPFCKSPEDYILVFMKQMFCKETKDME